MKNKIKQFFNFVGSGDIIGNNKIVYNSVENKKNSIYIEEIFYLLALNGKTRIELHKAALNAIFDLNASGNIWWLDETDVVIFALHENGDNLDKEIKLTLESLMEISPRLHSMIHKFYNHEINIRSSISSWLVCPSESLKKQTGYEFPEIYIRRINNMEDNLTYIIEEMESFKKEYFSDVK